MIGKPHLLALHTSSCVAVGPIVIAAPDTTTSPLKIAPNRLASPTPTGSLVCPARFVKMALEFPSGYGDQHSGPGRFLIGISPES